MSNQPEVIADDLSVLIGSHPIVYRLFDRDHRLLYIGSSIRVALRLVEHRRREWWPEVAAVRLQEHSTTDEMKKAELAAIEAEAPPHNVVGNASRLALDFGAGKPEDRHASPRRAYQLDDEKWERADRDAKAIGETRASVGTWLMEWWLGDRPAPPPRPD